MVKLSEVKISIATAIAAAFGFIIALNLEGNNCRFICISGINNK